MGVIIRVKCENCGYEREFQIVSETNVKSEKTESESNFLELVIVNGDSDTINYEDIIKTRYNHCAACRWEILEFKKMISC